MNKLPLLVILLVLYVLLLNHLTPKTLAARMRIDEPTLRHYSGLGIDIDVRYSHRSLLPKTQSEAFHDYLQCLFLKIQERSNDRNTTTGQHPTFVN